MQEMRILLHLTRAVRFEVALSESLLRPRNFFRLLRPLDFVLKEDQETVMWVHIARREVSIVNSSSAESADAGGWMVKKLSVHFCDRSAVSCNMSFS